ncbi:MAG: TetR/AcrR family transcriptional regulator [Novosphingobium sp.]|nr:TetR/AcrR family transcriptional regulator [Novosphingobium sp.]
MAEVVTKIDARMVRTQQSLRNAFLALIERKSLDDISIRDIVAEAGIGYATFFRHYSSKADLLQVVIADEISNLVSLALPALRPGDTFASSLALFEHVDEHRALWSALLTGGATGTIREEFAKVARALSGTKIGLEAWLPAELGVLYGVSGTVEIIAWWLRQDPPFPIDQIARIHDRLVLTPTVANATITA